MVPKLARPEFDAPVARIAQGVLGAIDGMRAFGRAGLWEEAVRATHDTARATSHLMRAQLVLLGEIAGGGGADAARVERFATGVELLHLFMLVHDDVMDNAQLRRGRPTLRVALAAAAPRLEWQQARDLAIVVGNVLNVLGTRLIQPGAGASAGEAAAAELVLEGCCRAGAGQFQDLIGFTGIEDEEALRRELIDKSAFHAFAAPFAAGVRLATGGADPEPALAWGRHVGTAFQAIDDLADVVGSPAVTGKDSLRDMLEGRPSLPIHFLRQRAEAADRELIDATLGRHNIEYGIRARLLDMVHELGVVEACAGWVRAEIAAAARVAEASGYAAAAREGTAAIERGLLAHLDKLVTSASSDE